MQAVYIHIPDYHAFWSGLSLYTELLLMWLGPAVLTFTMLSQRTRFAAIAAGLVAVSPVVAAVATPNLHWPGPYWVVYPGLVLAVFITTAIQRRLERPGQHTPPTSPATTCTTMTDPPAVHPQPADPRHPRKSPATRQPSRSASCLTQSGLPARRSRSGVS